jgi:hypothetical protein
LRFRRLHKWTVGNSEPTVCDVVPGNSITAAIEAAFEGYSYHCYFFVVQCLHNSVAQSAIIRKRFGAVVHRNASTFAHKLVVRSFIGVLKSSPAADIAYKDCVVLLSSADNVVRQAGKTAPGLERQATPSSVFVGPD